MLGCDHLDIEAADHADPGAERAVGGHVAAVEALHVREVGVEVGDLAVGHAEGGAEVAAVEDLRDRVVDVKIAAGVEEVGGEDEELAAAEVEGHAPVRDALEAVDDEAIDAEVRDEPEPDVGGVGVGVGGHEPAVDGGDDVRVLVAEEEVLELAALEDRGGIAEGLAVGLVAAGVEDDALAFVDDDVVVRLDGLAEILLVEEDVAVGTLFKKDRVGHGSSLTGSWRFP